MSEDGGQEQDLPGPVHCGILTIRTEGAGALLKGFVPAFLRMGPRNIIFFLVYERLKELSKA